MHGTRCSKMIRAQLWRSYPSCRGAPVKCCQAEQPATCTVSQQWGRHVPLNARSSTIRSHPFHLCFQHAAAVAVSAQLMLAPVGSCEELTIAVPVSRDPELRLVQQTLVETWAYVNSYFVDAKLNGLDWDSMLQDALKKTFKASNPSDAYKQVGDMVKALDDPFTRVLDPKDTAKYTAQKDGQVLSNGLIAVRVPDKGVRVSYVLDGSPAQQAGMTPGDEIVSVDGQPVGIDTDSNSLDLTALSTRDVNIEFTKTAESAAGVSEKPRATALAVQLVPTLVSINPVQYALLQQSEGAPPVGYVHLTSFTSTATDKVMKAVQDLKAQGASSLVLDLRDNPGGLVQSGLEVAQLFLRNGDVFCRVTDRQGEEQLAVIRQGQHLVDGPLMVLVNHNTTSTSELLAGALHDDYPAVLIGETTFGKGRTQLAFDLSDGSTLLVSTLFYTTPTGTVVDHKGLDPDVVCKPEQMEMTYWTPGLLDDGSLLDDPCIAMAYDKVRASLSDSASGV